MVYYSGGSQLTAILFSGELFENRKYLGAFEAKFENILGG
jgi:hypothetical protein